MTVIQITTIKRWNGLSSDIKPSSDVPEGSTFHAVDTGEQFVFHADMWGPDLRSTTASEAE